MLQEDDPRLNNAENSAGVEYLLVLEVPHEVDVALILPVVLLLVDCKLDGGVDLLTDCADGKAVGVEDELLNRLFNVSWNKGWDKIVPTSSSTFPSSNCCAPSMS